MMVNAGREIKETINCRNNLPSPGHQNCPDGEKWENAVVKSRLAKKKSLDSVSSRNAFVCRPRQLSLGSYTELHGRNQQRAVLSSPVFSKPGRPSDLPEKFSKFLETEFSIIKGENVNATQRYRLRSDSVPTQRRGPLYPNSTELRTLRSPSLSELRKPAMENANRNTRESSRCCINIDSFPPSGPRSSSVGEKWENDSGTEPFFVNKKASSNSPNSCRVSRPRFDVTHSLASEQKALFTASPKEVSPRMSPKEFGDRSLFSPTSSRHQIQELPLDLPEKFTKFSEMEFSIPKGENVSSTQKQKYSVALGSGSSREKVSLFCNPTELKKTQNPSSLLQRKVESEWLFVPDSGAPPSLYFNMTKLGAWSSTVDYIEECLDVVKKNLNCFFSEEQRNLAKRLVGQITFEALGMCEMYRVSEIASVLVDAVISLGKNNASKTWSDPVQGLVDYLQSHGHKDKRLKKVRKTMTQQEELSSDIEDGNAYGDDGDSDDEFATAEFETKEQASKPCTGISSGEKRTLVAHEILTTEIAYMKCLSIILDVFKKPLQASLASNRAIISSANIQSLFADSETLLALSSLLVNDLSNRLDEWNSHQMLGDIFLRFTTQLRAYTNFLNNYPVTLQTLERCKEQNPQFRSFLGRQEKQPSTKMMSLPELLFLPGRRIKSYVELLESFMKYTPSDHVDRKTLAQAIVKFKDLDSLFRQYKERLEREKFLQDLQKRIVNCPVLAEKSRHFIREEDVILLSTPSTGKQVKPEFRVYQQVGDLGLFLFNDALVIARLTFKFVPFQRLVQRNYKFQACLTLKKIKVENLADTKYVKNAFTIVSPKRLWLCQAHSWDQKFQWISVLESSITAALEKS